MRFKKILACTDFSASSREAFTTAVAMATDTGAELVLVHVVEVYPYYGDLPGLPAAQEQAMVTEASVDLDVLVKEAKQAGAKLVSGRRLTGIPWQQIVELLEMEPSFDLAIVATHGRTGIKRVLLGSIAEKIVRHAPCPVLVVRA